MLKNKTKEGSEGLREGTSVDGEDNETKILGLKYKYAEGQWSPLNPEGKKHYGREFLLQLQHDYNAIQKPSGLPDIPEIMLDNDKPLGKDGEMTRGNSGGQELIDFISKYVWGGGDKKLTFGKPRSDLPESQPAPTEFTVSSEKDMEKKTKAILDKYFVTPNMKVVILSVQKVSTENHRHFVYNAINHVLKRSSQARKQTGHILRNLVKQSVISLDNYLRGLVEVLEFAEDLEISIPKIWQYYGELISPMAQDNSIFSSVKQAAAPLILDNKNGVLAVKLFYASQNEVLYMKTRSILNKLTPQKFQTLVSQMQALPIDSEEKLKGVINLVFEKAISEPSYGVAYANMCRCLSMFKVQSDSKPEKMVNFRAVLLTRCQRKFEKDKSSEALFVTKRKDIEKAEDDAQKEKLKKELKYEESKAKQRSLGNIRFMGELFKLKMLTENVMHNCVFKLLRTKDPEKLECLCQLLTTIGKTLDVDKAKPRMNQYFQQIGKIVNERKTSPRVRFILLDVMDLRTNKWVPRRVDDSPKTIDQIHKEAAQEAQEKALLSQQNQMQQRAQRGCGPFGQMGGADGWNTVCVNRTPLKSVERSIDSSTMKLTKGLEHRDGGDCALTTPTTGIPLTDIEVKLHELIVQNKADNETVFDWIESNVDDPTRGAKFIRALMTAVCYSAIKGEKGKERLAPKEISARNDLLQRYLHHNFGSELQALYAVQALVSKLKHPQGVLRGLLDTLYDEDIISEEVFFQWEKSEEEPEGKDMCLKQAIQFFTWLREDEEDSF